MDVSGAAQAIPTKWTHNFLRDDELSLKGPGRRPSSRERSPRTGNGSPARGRLRRRRGRGSLGSSGRPVRHLDGAVDDRVDEEDVAERDSEDEGLDADVDSGDLTPCIGAAVERDGEVKVVEEANVVLRAVHLAEEHANFADRERRSPWESMASVVRNCCRKDRKPHLAATSEPG